MKPRLTAVLAASIGCLPMAAAMGTGDLPAVSRESLSIETVHRGDLICSIDAQGALRRTRQSLEAILNMTAADVPDIMVGQPATIGTARSPGGPLTGRVSRVQAGGGETFQVAVALDGSAEGVEPEERVAASIQTGRFDDVLLLPGGGRRKLSTGSVVSLFKLEPGSSQYAQRVQVRIGKVTASHVEIRSGLNEGDRVIVNWLNGVPADANRIRLN
jgi:hypothetical protein